MPRREIYAKTPHIRYVDDAINGMSAPVERTAIWQARHDSRNMPWRSRVMSRLQIYVHNMTNWSLTSHTLLLRVYTPIYSQQTQVVAEKTNSVRNARGENHRAVAEWGQTDAVSALLSRTSLSMAASRAIVEEQHALSFAAGIERVSTLIYGVRQAI